MSIAWILVGIFGTACALLGWFHQRELSVNADTEAYYQGELAAARAENAKLLATALEAKGAILVDPAQSQRELRAVPRPSSIYARMAELQREDAQKAMDRDARVAAEMEDARRVVEETRKRLEASH
jgi:hypothetical protein